MTRREAQLALLLALALVVAGAVWLYGPWGLLVGGVALALLVLFVIDVKEPDGEALARPAGAGLRDPVQR